MIAFLSELMNMNSCYMCDTPASTREHVPPLCLFPGVKDTIDGRDHRRNLITVPSCITHNLMKSHDDEFLLYTFAMNLTSNDLARQLYSSKVKRSMEYKPKLIRSIMRNIMHVRADDSITGLEIQTIAYPVDYNRLLRALDLIARALYFHHCNCHCRNEIVIDPEFILKVGAADSNIVNESISRDHKMLAHLFENIKYYGDNPEVFQYQIIKDSELPRFAMRLYFYEGSIVNINSI